MKPHIAIKKVTATVLLVTLLPMPYGFGSQTPKTEQQRIETCRRLLESLVTPNNRGFAPPRISQAPKAQKLVDLTDADLSRFSSATSHAKFDEVLVINEQRLGDGRFASALSRSPALFTVASTTGYKTVEDLLHLQVGRPEIIAAIPTNATGVTKVFGVPASQSAPIVKYMEATAGQFRTVKNAHLLNFSIDARSLADNLISKAKRDTSDVFIVVAHNERGILKLPDGSSVRVDMLYKALGRRPGVIISCDTINSDKAPANALLTNRELDFKDIATALGSAEKLLSANPDASLGELVFAFSQNIPARDPGSEKTVKVVAMVVGGLIVIGLLYYWVCEDSDSPSTLCAQPAKSKR